MSIIDKVVDARNIVSENYQNSDNMVLSRDILLEASKAIEGYRPFYVAAMMAYSEYRQLIQAETVKFQYSLDNIKALLGIQKALDNSLSGIPEGFTVDDALLKIDNIFEASFYTNGMFNY